MAQRINDREQEDWVNNDEGLYVAWKQSGQSLGAFVSEHRAMIDEVIHNVTEGKKSAHYLRYGG